MKHPFVRHPPREATPLDQPRLDHR
jgi:hypothetical protein